VVGRRVPGRVHRGGLYRILQPIAFPEIRIEPVPRAAANERISAGEECDCWFERFLRLERSLPCWVRSSAISSAGLSLNNQRSKDFLYSPPAAMCRTTSIMTLAVAKAILVTDKVKKLSAVSAGITANIFISNV
jgi:hypothetical protein